MSGSVNEACPATGVPLKFCTCALHVPVEQVRRQHPFAVPCRSCKQLVVWFKTAKGNNMPVDESSTQPADAQHQLDLSRHKSHFATCPNADQHRRPR